jgi:transcriptional regulator with XRE-family HTH domain
MSQDIAPSIDLNLREKLRDRDYRRKFFWAETSAQIAAYLIKLRKRRALSQKELAELVGTKQPAISRIEQSDYENWNLGTLRCIAEAEDARVRVIIEPAEDVLGEYDEEPVCTKPDDENLVGEGALNDFNRRIDQRELQLSGFEKPAGSAVTEDAYV